MTVWWMIKWCKVFSIFPNSESSSLNSNRDLVLPGCPEPHTHIIWKLQDWTLEVWKRTLFMGDSNQPCIPAFTDPYIQVYRFLVPQCTTWMEFWINWPHNGVTVGQSTITVASYHLETASTDYFSNRFEMNKRDLIIKLNTAITDKCYYKLQKKTAVIIFKYWKQQFN